MNELTNRQKLIATMSTRILDGDVTYSDYLADFINYNIDVDELLKSLPELEEVIDIRYWSNRNLPNSLFSNIKNIYSGEFIVEDMAIAISSLITRSYIEIKENDILNTGKFKLNELSSLLDDIVNDLYDNLDELISRFIDIMINIGIDEKFNNDNECEEDTD